MAWQNGNHGFDNGLNYKLPIVLLVESKKKGRGGGGTIFNALLVVNSRLIRAPVITLHIGAFWSNFVRWHVSPVHFWPVAYKLDLVLFELDSGENRVTIFISVFNDSFFCSKSNLFWHNYLRLGQKNTTMGFAILKKPQLLIGFYQVYTFFKEIINQFSEMWKEAKSRLCKPDCFVL